MFLMDSKEAITVSVTVCVGAHHSGRTPCACDVPRHLVGIVIPISSSWMASKTSCTHIRFVMQSNLSQEEDVWRYCLYERRVLQSRWRNVSWSRMMYFTWEPRK